jgi:hypothetical protein
MAFPKKELWDGLFWILFINISKVINCENFTEEKLFLEPLCGRENEKSIE